MNVLVCGACFDELDLDREEAISGPEADRERSWAMEPRAKCPVCMELFRTLPTGDTLNADLVGSMVLIRRMGLDLRRYKKHVEAHL